jgi:hypothetical protein
MKIVQKEHIKESQIKKIFLDLFSFFAKEGVTVHCVFQLTWWHENWAKKNKSETN